MSKIKSATFIISCVDMKDGAINSMNYTLGKTDENNKQTSETINSTKSALISKVRSLEGEGVSVTIKTSKNTIVKIVNEDKYLTTYSNDITKDNLSELGSCTKKYRFI